MDIWISVYTDAQTTSDYTYKIVLNYVLHTTFGLLSLSATV